MAAVFASCPCVQARWVFKAPRVPGGASLCPGFGSGGALAHLGLGPYVTARAASFDRPFEMGDPIPVLVADHHRLRRVDGDLHRQPPPPVGHWRLLRGMDDPNRVLVIGEVDRTQVDQVKEFVSSERMQAVFAQVNAMSTKPREIVWLDEVKPG